ncbi:ubiquitin family proteint [Ramaria rubella]|nr:ubiquitin family proteint [Ramaria rubella]
MSTTEHEIVSGSGDERPETGVASNCFADQDDSTVSASDSSNLNQTNTEVWISLRVTHGGKELSLSIEKSDRVFDLKGALFELTNVPPERQKILGLVKGKLPPDDVCIDDLKLNPGKRFTLIGTPQGSEFKDPFELEDLPEVLNDLDVDFSADPSAATKYLADQRNHRKIREAVTKLKIEFMNPLRDGKRLLVLDLDYTILDTKPLTSGALPPAECARPRLHEFLEAVYPHYDICIWSQTSWVWLETKLVELGMVGSDKNYKTIMFRVFSKRDGKPYEHAVKALRIIWTHLPQFNERNTIHIDDLGRNFALNPNEGLKISPFKDAYTARAAQDRELDKLARYLVFLAGVEDFRTVNHKDWKKLTPP